MANKKEAAKLLRDNNSSAFACMRAMDALFTEQWLVWEPETCWLTLARQGVTVSTGNRAQLMAGRGLLIHGRYWYDAILYEKTVMALNNEEPQLSDVGEAPVAYMAWAASEAEMINKYYESEDLAFDYEVINYTTLRLFDDGYALAPETLRWCQRSLDEKLHSDALKLKNKVRKAWALMPKGEALKEEELPETDIGVHIAKLAAVDHYVSKRNNRLQLDLAALES